MDDFLDALFGGDDAGSTDDMLTEDFTGGGTSLLPDVSGSGNASPFGSLVQRAVSREISSSLSAYLRPARRRVLSHGHTRVAADHYGLNLTRLQSTAGLARLLQRANRNL